MTNKFTIDEEEIENLAYSINMTLTLAEAFAPERHRLSIDRRKQVIKNALRDYFELPEVLPERDQNRSVEL